MQSPYKKILVYDLETGGLKSRYASITEIALVAVDLDTLNIEEEFSVLLKPRLNLSYRTEPLADAKMLYKELGEKDSETGVKTLLYKGKKVTLKNVSIIEEDIIPFYKELDNIYPDSILELEDIREFEKSEHKDIIELFFNNSYNPQALDVTKISRALLEKEGLEYKDAYQQIINVIDKYTVGNSKPIFAGHNIGSLPRRIVRGKEKAPDGFDNPFMEIFFRDNGGDFFDSINDKIIDTLKEARIKWYELPAYNLGTCANEVSLTLKEAHRALPDTVANAKLLIKMLKSYQGEGSQQSTYKRKKFSFNF